jgi:mannose-1-phosphate guanylyltransferase
MYYAVIMAGGSGTRLWPLSREKYPKQALKLIGDRTMFQHAVDRLLPMFSPEQIHVVTCAEHVAILAEQSPTIPCNNFILEPEGRGTAAAIGLAALILREKDPGAVMAVLTADHYIADTDKFRIVLSAAEQIAQGGYLVTLGIQPTEPATGFGYIHQGKWLREVAGQAVYEVVRFVEKPEIDEARRMIASGQYSWNSGMFIWKVKRIMQEFERQMPEFYEQLSLIEAARTEINFAEHLETIWKGVRKNTIDYGIMEGAQDVVVIPVSMGWADIGSWSSLFELLNADEHGNIQVGEVISLGSQGNLVFGGKRLIAAVGVEDLIIIDTEDALLVCKRGCEQDVKTIVSRLKENKRSELL